jgi:hypothetical protein
MDGCREEECSSCVSYDVLGICGVIREFTKLSISVKINSPTRF